MMAYTVLDDSVLHIVEGFGVVNILHKMEIINVIC